MRTLVTSPDEATGCTGVVVAEHFALFRATGALDDLRIAHELLLVLLVLREGTLDDWRESILQNVPLNRDIAEEWARQDLP